MDRKRKRMESRNCEVISKWHNCSIEHKADRALTEDELFGRCQHVQRKGDFILVAFALEPAQQRGGV
jgi:hypothetical protein